MENGLLRAMYSISTHSLHVDDYLHQKKVMKIKTDILENVESQY